MGSKMAIAIITNRGVKAETVRSVMNLMATTKHQLLPIVATQGYTIAENRAFAVIQAIKAGCSHILFLDDDMIFPEDTLEKLLAHKQEVVGVYSFSRALPLTPTVAFMDENGNHLPHDQIAIFKRPAELFECFSIGMGVALIDLKVFDVIDKPWFEFRNHPSGKNLVGEDAWFCEKAKEKGYKIWCDPTIDIKHIGDYQY